MRDYPTRRISSPIEMGLLFLSVGFLLFIATLTIYTLYTYLSLYCGITGEIALASTVALLLTMDYVEWLNNARYRPRRINGN